MCSWTFWIIKIRWNLFNTMIYEMWSDFSGSKRPTTVGELRCEKCIKNETKYGKVKHIDPYCRNYLLCSLAERVHVLPATCRISGRKMCPLQLFGEKARPTPDLLKLQAESGVSKRSFAQGIVLSWLRRSLIRKYKKGYCSISRFSAVSVWWRTVAVWWKQPPKKSESMSIHWTF